MDLHSMEIKITVSIMFHLLSTDQFVSCGEIIKPGFYQTLMETNRPIGHLIFSRTNLVDVCTRDKAEFMDVSV